MQTFLPYPSFEESAECLDNRRLGKQRVETLQILNTLSLGAVCNKCNNCGKNYKRGLMNCPHCDYNGFHIIKTPWYNHPAVKQWWTYENHLVDYGVAICDEWVRRGFRDTCKEKILKYQKLAPNGFKGMYVNWLGNEEFHSSHRAALLYKNFNYYSAFGWKESPIQKYWWPSEHT